MCEVCFISVCGYLWAGMGAVEMEECRKGLNCLYGRAERWRLFWTSCVCGTVEVRHFGNSPADCIREFAAFGRAQKDRRIALLRPIMLISRSSLLASPKIFHTSAQVAQPRVGNAWTGVDATGLQVWPAYR
jgi:hypothetical protein